MREDEKICGLATTPGVKKQEEKQREAPRTQVFPGDCSIGGSGSSLDKMPVCSNVMVYVPTAVLPSAVVYGSCG